jgi:hypothetical protein
MASSAHDVDKKPLEAGCGKLHDSIARLGADRNLQEFIKLIPQPWITTPAEYAFINAVSMRRKRR